MNKPKGLGQDETMVAPSESQPGVGPSPSSTQGSLTPAADVIAGRYEILGLVGAGGMGRVYRVRDRELDEVVALKVLRHELVGTASALERFKREVKLSRRVTHPNVARMYDIGEHSGEKFLTMELVEGDSLDNILARSGRPSLSRVLELTRAVCEGLAAAHRAGVVHRDLKPDNVMLDQNGRILITDFGIARGFLESEGGGTVGAIGTPAYMAPEQVRGDQNIDARADIYALGVMLYELLTGDLPFTGTSPYVVAAARLHADPPDPRLLQPDIPGPIAELTLRCMARDPVRRFASIDELLSALTAATPTQGTGSLTGFAPAVTHSQNEKTVAVLPFRNGGPPDDDYVADGLTEDLIDTLSMTPGLKLRPRSAVLQYTGPAVDARAAGGELGVEVVVEGSVRRAGDKLRVSARLLSVSDGFQLWARRFDRQAADLLVVSDEAAKAIGDALTIELSSRQRQAPTDPVAIDLYLKARAEYRKTWREPTERAVQLLTEAHRRAPDDATILATYARACLRLWFHGTDDPEWPAHTRRLAERATQIGPDNPEAWVALGGVHIAEGDYPGSVPPLKRALALSSTLPEAHEAMARVLAETGPLDRAISEYEATLALDPTLFNVRMELARCYALNGEFDRSWKLADLDVTDPDAARGLRVIRARMTLWSRDAERAKQIPASTGSEGTPLTWIHVVREAFETGKVADEYRQALAVILKRTGTSQRFRSLIHQLACETYCFVGDLDYALEALEGSRDNGLLDAMWLERCPLLEPLRQLPRFQAVAREVGERADAVRLELAKDG